MTFSQRVFSGDPPDLVGRSPEDYARELENYLREAATVARESIPAGFLGTDPLPVSLATASVSPGTENAGWAAADHVHWVDFGFTLPGDFLTFDGTGVVVESMGGAPDGHVLTVDAAAPTGRSWQAPTGGGAAAAPDSATEPVLDPHLFALRDIIAKNFR